MALDTRIKKLEETLSNNEDDLILLSREGDKITDQERAEAIAEAKASGQRVVFLGQLGEWSK
jgi:hypothetical protein